ncbi:MAG TPA: HAMP domain-containing sensor histidine kinase [Vicinamibacteria bacterium]
MRRLYLQVYVAFVGILLLFGMLMIGAWHLVPSASGEQQALESAAALAAELLGPPLSPEAQRTLLRRVAAPANLDLTLWSAEGEALAQAGAALPFPGRERRQSAWLHGRGGPMRALRLADGRWLVARHRHGPARYRGVGLLLVFLLLALAVAIGAYPVARRLTRRLERLRAGVEGLAGGDLRARVPVEGRDEVADLARSFNRAAERIEALVGAQRTLLAGASHELRTPLTRIRMALELDAPDPARRARLEADIAELDALIGELLLASRLQSAPVVEPGEDVDLLGLAAEEAARAGAAVDGRPAAVRGDARLLRRLVRNLIENGRRHGGGTPVEVSVAPEGGRVHLRVCDRGPGVAPAERERIFDAFYRAPGAAADEGAGLGLALVRQIARRHGGDTRHESREGGGSCFVVDLPASAVTAPSRGASPD